MDYILDNGTAFVGGNHFVINAVIVIQAINSNVRNVWRNEKSWPIPKIKYANQKNSM